MRRIVRELARPLQLLRVSDAFGDRRRRGNPMGAAEKWQDSHGGFPVFLVTGCDPGGGGHHRLAQWVERQGKTLGVAGSSPAPRRTVNPLSPSATPHVCGPKGARQQRTGEDAFPRPRVGCAMQRADTAAKKTGAPPFGEFGSPLVRRKRTEDPIGERNGETAAQAALRATDVSRLHAPLSGIFK